jgi:hypothetical protein
VEAGHGTVARGAGQPNRFEEAGESGLLLGRRGDAVLARRATVLTAAALATKAKRRSGA